MGSGMIGFVIGLWAMTVAVAGILQFVLGKIPSLKSRLAASYIPSYIIGLLLLLASPDFDVPHYIAAVGFSVCMFWLYRRDVAKKTKEPHRLP